MNAITALADTYAVPTIDLQRPEGAPSLGEAPTEAAPGDRGAGAASAGRPALEGAGFEALGLLGEGGMGVVLAARERDLRRVVALKHLRETQTHQRAVFALLREAQITAQLDHPNIPPVHALGVDPAGRPYFTMARIQGVTLSDLLRRRGADPEARAALGFSRALRLMIQVSNAVAFAHAAGVVHRDLKPSNVILGDYGEVRVMDWGIAKVMGQPDDAAPLEPSARAPVALEEGAPRTEAGTFIGTLGYAPPEQLRDASSVDARADIYALGAMLYALFSGRPPVEGESHLALISATLEGEIRPLSARVDVPPRLEAVVQRALAPDPAARYGDVRALIEDLEALLEERPVSALEEDTLTRWGRAYMGRSIRFARLKNIDLDLSMGSSFSFGVACGVGAAWLSSSWGALIGGACAVGLLLALRPAYVLLRPARPEDPDHAGARGDGAPLSQRLSQPPAPPDDEL